MANFEGFQNSVRKVMNARTLGTKDDPDPLEEEEDQVKPGRRRSFHKLVKKVVLTQAIGNVDYRTISYNKHVLYPSRSRSCIRRVPIVGGEPITSDTAVELRTQVFGAADLLTFSLTEWLGQPFSFHEAGTALAYGLKAHNSSTKGLVMCVQAYILKHLLFTSHKSGAVGDVLRLLRTSRRAQMDSLVAALSDILWKAGERQHAVLCLTQEENYVNDNPSYIYDGCTEKIVIFEFARYDELKFTIKKHLYELVSENGNGLLLFLYSLILSRTFPRVTEDLGGETVTFLFTNGAIHPSLATLMLTGRATLFLHNGIIYEGSEDTMAKPKTGIVTRAELGLLAWKREEGCNQIKIGSRMKTPTLPIWISRCNDSYGLLFNPNKDLLRDYHAENRFDLYYYSCNSSQTAATVLTIDTRAHASKDEHQSPSLENLIHTKWQDAEVSWNGTAPYV